MPFVPLFSISQTAAAPGTVVITDDSTGSDVLVTSRRVFISDSDGEYIVASGVTTDYNSWPLITNPLILTNLISEDNAVTIKVQWLDSGDAVRYEVEDTFCLRKFNISQFCYLIQQQALSPEIVQDANYYSNLCQYWINIVGANTMIEEADNLSASQNCLERATFMLNNEEKFF